MSETIFRQDYQAPSHLVSTVNLEFDLDVESTSVISTLHVVPNPEAQNQTGEFMLNGEGLTLVSVAVNGEQLDETQYDLTPEILTLHNINTEVDLTIVNRFSPAANTKLQGIYASGKNLISQCEAEGFRAITYFPDRPDVLARYHVTIRASKEEFPILLSNGNRISERDLEDGRHETVWDDPFAKPCYLFALVAGKFECQRENIKLKDGRIATLEVWVEPQDIDKTAHTMESLKKAIRWDEERWGLDLDLDHFAIVATNDFNFGAMENKGLNIFNARYALANPKVATDQDYASIEAVVGHEYFHNWTGDRVTLRDWFQLTLKEGLTVFRDQEFSADMLGDESARAVERIKNVKALRLAQFSEDSGPMAHPIRPDSYQAIDNFYTMTVYEKGAEVIRMLQTILGRDGFRRGFDRYIAENDGSAVTCEHFINAVLEGTPVDKELFKRWYSQAGTPRVTVSSSYDAQAHTLTLTCAQSTPPTPGQPTKDPVLIPFPVALFDRQGRALSLKLEDEPFLTGKTEELLQLTTNVQTWVFTDVPSQSVLSLNRGFAAPVIVEYDYSDEDLALLAKHDTDAFNRWEAMQKLMLRELLAQVNALLSQEDRAVSPTLFDAFEALITDPDISPAYKAVAMELPSEKTIGDALPLIDPWAVHHAREFVRERLGTRTLTKLEDIVNENQTPGDYSPNTQDAGRRSLKNTALYYMVATANKHAILLVRDQFLVANNLTDKLAALRLLSGSSSPVKTDLNRETLESWINEPLLLNKWFTIQATAPCLPGEIPVVNRVRDLVKSGLFNMKNPNNVYALLSAFFHSNAVEFHRPDGTGYQFWAQMVQQLDAINPNVAARVARSLENWRRYTPDLSSMMFQTLKFMQSRQDKLSPQVNEIISKALNNPS